MPSPMGRGGVLAPQGHVTSWRGYPRESSKAGEDMQELEFAEKIAAAGGRAYVVGGAVRDELRGAAPKDKDYMVTGMSEENFLALFLKAHRVGRSFPVYLLELEGKSSEVAFARRERKEGHGYRGFVIEHSPAVTVEEDLFRRDTAMNSIARDLITGELVDPYGGREDIEKRRIRAVSRHFLDDPVRALRAARQAAELGFEIEPKTLLLMRMSLAEIEGEPMERLTGELTKALASPRPSRFFRALRAAGILSIYPEIEALIGKTQPAAFHPEGDAFEHTMLVVDKVAAETSSIIARFSGLAHDLGKGVTPASMLPHHYGHELKGLDVLEKWAARETLPREWLRAARFVIREHMRAPRILKRGKMADLLMETEKHLPLADFLAVIRADHGGLPPYLEHARELIAAMKKVSGASAPEGLKGEEIGAWLRGQRTHTLTQKLREIEK